MPVGSLRSRVGFYAPVKADDGYGNTTTAFDPSPDFAVAAKIVPRLGGEKVLADRLTGTNYVNITVRQSNQMRRVTPVWRAKDERSGVIYNVRSIIDPDEGLASVRTWFELLCEKGVAT